MNERGCVGASADDVGCPRMIAIGQQNACDSHAGYVGECLLAGRYRIDAQVALPVANHVTAEVVSVRFGEPRIYLGGRSRYFGCISFLSSSKFS